MSEIFRQFMVQTPLWVWVLLAYLIHRGIKARRPARTSLPKLAVVPAIFTAWGLADLARLYGLEAGTAALWLAGIALGSVIGWRLLARADIRADASSGMISRPADMTLLPLLLVAFGVKYSFGVIAATSPQLLHQAGFRAADLLLCGAFTGIFIGKFARYALAHRTTRSAFGA
ncbi:DUF6622 family protein [Paracoccus aerius]|nr:DUF6622 family protein [Paracoccus aerius]GHG21706.1 hypothetical protein GCM10017322_19030 [Paracoccus aerius]